MEHLPDELLVLIVEGCDFPSLKTLRVTSRRLSRLTTPLIFGHVHCGMFNESISKLLKMATHESIRLLVKKLTYHGEILPYYVSKEQWLDHTDHRPSFSQFFRNYCRERDIPDLWKNFVESSDPSAGSYEHKGAALILWENLPKVDSGLDLDTHYRNYTRLYLEQETEHEEMGKHFQFAVGLMLNLTEIKLSSPRLGVAKNSGPVWRDVVSQTLQGPDDWMFFVSNEENESRVGLDGVRQLTHLLKAMSIRDPGRYGALPVPIRTLRFSTSNNIFWCQGDDTPLAGSRIFPDDLGGHEVDRRIYDMRHAFSNLTILELKISFDQTWDRREWIAGGMRAFLQEAKHLQTLSLRYEEEIKDREDDALDDPLQILGDIHWPALHTFLASFTTREDLLLNFFKRHAASLRNLSLIDMALARAHGSWASLIHSIPEILSLNSIKFESLWDSNCENGHGAGLFEVSDDNDYEQLIENYCLHGGAPPLVYPWEWNKAHPDRPITDFISPIAESDQEEDDADEEEEDQSSSDVD